MLDAALEDLKSSYRRINVVFDGDPPAALSTPGIEQVRREGRMLSLLASGNVERIVAEARSLNALSVDVLPVGLKEIFLERVKDAAENGR